MCFGGRELGKAVRRVKREEGRVKDGGARVGGTGKMGKAKGHIVVDLPPLIPLPNNPSNNLN